MFGNPGGVVNIDIWVASKRSSNSGVLLYMAEVRQKGKQQHAAETDETPGKFF